MDRAEMERRIATETAEGFRRRTIERIDAVLAEHNAAVVEFACEMQARVEAAEKLLAAVASRARLDTSKRTWRTLKLRATVVKQIEALVASARARNDDGHHS